MRQRTQCIACGDSMPKVRWRTDRTSSAENTVDMNTFAKTTSPLPRSLLFAGLTAFALVAAMPPWSSAQAQSVVVASMSRDGAERLHAEALAMERRHDYEGAFAAFLAAAESGFPPSQRRLGEIYDQGSPAVPRNYEQSIHWYQKASDGGEDIPWVGSRMPGLNYGP